MNRRPYAKPSNTTEVDPLQFTGSVDDLGFPPYSHPDRLGTNLGNERCFRYSHMNRLSDAEVIYTYFQPGTGAQLDVIDDRNDQR